MSLPPVPPRPPTVVAPPNNNTNNYESPPHFDNPLVAPRPHRVDPQIAGWPLLLRTAMSCDCPLLLWGWCWDDWQDTQDDDDDADNPFDTPQMARDLDNSMNQQQQAQLNPGSGSAFLLQPGAARTPSPLPPPQAATSAHTVPDAPARLPSPPRDGSLTVPVPSVPALTAALATVTAPSHDPALQLAWARDVLFLVDRTPALATSPLALAAAPLVLTLAQGSMPEAMYLRATFAASGQFPNVMPANPRAAFRDFEAAARAGHAPAWFRLARDYEAFNDTPHALDCLNRGAKARDPAALHRLGVAHLLGQLSLHSDPNQALPYLHQAAVRATLQCPQPAYVFALILLGEFTPSPTPVSHALLQPFLPQGQTHEGYARAMLERAAALHFAPAQYKLGHAFEFAVPASAFPFDPLLSVQWYSLASQAGEAEADMALSKWFLCGAEGAFEKDEGLARTFAGKAGGSLATSQGWDGWEKKDLEVEFAHTGWNSRLDEFVWTISPHPKSRSRRFLSPSPSSLPLLP
ncbi:hypothetical protein B0H13DRAFT_2338792 [Mycena leptocephala]|nr:hypothetical protein B0H13DRAFT_2338792 [Mycena leptocephala]